MVGWLVDRDRDGQHEIVLIFNTLTARQKDAAQVVREFGADQVMMLDGGGSTQLLCQGQDIIASERLIPQALGIVADQEKGFLATPDSQPEAFEEMNTDIPEEETPIKPEPSSTVTVQPSIAPEASETVDQPSSDAQDPAAGLDFSNLAWVPVIMAPIGAILFLLIKSRSSSNTE